MEDFGTSLFDCALKKKRSRTSHRPRPDSHSHHESRGSPILSSTLTFESASGVSGDRKRSFDNDSRKKQLNLSQSFSRDCAVKAADDKSCRKNEKKGEQTLNDIKRTANGSFSSSVQFGATTDGSGNVKKLRKLTFKVGGETLASSAKHSQSSESSKSGLTNLQQGDLSNGHSVPETRSGLRGIPWKDFSQSSMVKVSGSKVFEKEGGKSDQVRKSKRAPKRRVFDGELSEEENDGEIRFLEKQRELSKIFHVVNGSSKAVKDGNKKLPSEKASDDMDCEQNEKDDTYMNGDREAGLTTRQRALRSSKDGSCTKGSSLMEFPDGLAPVPSKRQKEKLTDVEEQLRKTEAAQKRRLQVEKAAKESEAEAIRKILGQDSARKKREDKIKKRQEELAQVKAANSVKVPPNTIRCTDGPAGIVVTFSEDIALPHIFDPKPYSYPAPRELCAGPSCTNPYKYRHSKLNVPLCSLKCYKAVDEQMKSKMTD